MKNSDKSAEILVPCRFCLSDIPQGAVKCRFCREWLTDHFAGQPGSSATAEEKVNGAKGSEPLPPVAFQSRLAALFPTINYWILYLGISMLLYFAISMYWTFGEEDRVFLISFFFNAMQMFFSAAGMVWFEKLLDRFRFEIPIITGWTRAKSEEYYLEARKRIFASNLPIAVGLLICTVAVFGDYFIVGTPFRSDGAKLAYLMYEFCFLFWSASAIVYFIKFAMFIREFGDQDLRILIIQEENSGIRLLGKFIQRTTLFAIIPYVCSIVARHIGGWNFGSLLSVWFGCFGVAILFYLFWPIYNIHCAMIREKDRKLSLVSLELNVLLSGQKLDKEHIHNLRNLMEIRNYLHEINAWPFDMSKIIALLSAVIIPMASILVDRILKSSH